MENALPCRYCGMYHIGTCPRVKELRADGSVVFHGPPQFYGCKCAEKDAEIERLREALEWYGEQTRLCRLIHSEGDNGRQALANDGGKRAEQALAPKGNDRD